MKKSLIQTTRLRYLALIPAIVLMGAIVGCSVEQKDAGELPDVDVDVEPAELPEYEVEGPDVEVGSKEAEVTVPDVDVSTEETTIEVPTVDIEVPSDEPEAEAN